MKRPPGQGAAGNYSHRGSICSREAAQRQALPPKRSVLSFGRDLVFAADVELAKRMGCAKHYWLRATLDHQPD